MQRRRFVQSLFTLGAATPVIAAIENIRDGVDDTIGVDEGLHVDDWEEKVAEYGHTYRFLPPHRLMPELAADLVAVQQIIAHRAGDRLMPSWYRVTGVLAALMAKTLANLEQPRPARHWWTTARHATMKSGDTDLGLWINAERLTYGLYERRPAFMLLQQADDAIAQAPGSPSKGLIHTRAIRAQLLAVEGRTEDAAKEFRSCEEMFQHLPASVTGEARSIYGWPEGRLRYVEAWVAAFNGDSNRLDTAVTQALPTMESRVRTQLELLRASGHVRAGDATEGVRHAHTVYEAQPVEQRTAFVTSLAKQVIESVPEPRRAEPTVAAYRELMRSGSARLAIT